MAAFNIFRDLVSNDRHWRLWSLRPRLYFVPYRFTKPRVPTKFENSAWSHQRSFRIPLGAFAPEQQPLIFPELTGVFFLKGVYPPNILNMAFSGSTVRSLIPRLAYDDLSYWENFPKYRTVNVYSIAFTTEFPTL